MQNNIEENDIEHERLCFGTESAIFFDIYLRTVDFNYFLS